MKTLKLVLGAAACLTFGCVASVARAESAPQPSVNLAADPIVLAASYECMAEALKTRANHLRRAHVDSTEEELQRNASACMANKEKHDRTLREHVALLAISLEQKQSLAEAETPSAAPGSPSPEHPVPQTPTEPAGPPLPHVRHYEGHRPLTPT